MSTYEFEWHDTLTNGELLKFSGDVGDSGDLESIYPTLKAFVMPMHPEDKRKWVDGQDKYWNEGIDPSDEEEYTDYSKVSQWMVLLTIQSYSAPDKPEVEVSVWPIADDYSGPWDTPEVTTGVASLDVVMHEILSGTLMK